MIVDSTNTAGRRLPRSGIDLSRQDRQSRISHHPRRRFPQGKPWTRSNANNFRLPPSVTPRQCLTRASTDDHRLLPSHRGTPAELREHLFTRQDFPSVTPYRTSYHRETWGFCLRQHMDALPEGEYEVVVDSSLEAGSLTYDSFQHAGRWWPLSETAANGRHETLRLHWADTLTGPWREHPKSPIVAQDAHIARPAGRVLVFGDRIIRFAQDCALVYGLNVRAFEVVQLSPQTYFGTASWGPDLGRNRVRMERRLCRRVVPASRLVASARLS
jgi:hypothetical protein